jgi:CRISPR system Cascade subunit CasB
MTTTTAATTTGTEKSLRQSFIEYLEELHEKEDRAALAALRRGLGKRPGEEMSVYRYIGWCADKLNGRQEEAYHLIATLFGLYPSESWRSSDGDPKKTNLGASLRRLKEQMGGDGAERRFVALLNANRVDLGEHLRQIIGLLKSKDVPVDWAQLLEAVEFWDADDERRRQRQWAKTFWREDKEGA